MSTATQQPDERSDFHCQLDREEREALEYARALLSHAIPNGDMGRIVGRAAKALVREVEKEMFGSTDRPGKSRGSADPRHIPLAVKREVWKRDGGQCAFHSDDGKRCPSRELMQFHHMVEVALGGTASVANISLRCRAHNQYESEKTFGKAFMDHKREQAKATSTKKRGGRRNRFVLDPEQQAVEDQRLLDWFVLLRHSREDAQWALDQADPRDFPLPGYRQVHCQNLLYERRLSRSSSAESSSAGAVGVSATVACVPIPAAMP